MSQKNKYLPFFLIAFAVLGYFREFFFVHINNIMFQKYYNTTSELATPKIMHVFTTVSYNWLYYSKYIYTLLWTVLFFSLNYLALKKLTNNHFLIKILFYSYAAMLIIATISMAYGWLVNSRLQNDEYTVSRWLLGIAQSPIICLILLASEKLYNKSLPS